MLEAVDSIDELRAALAKPEDFFKEAASSLGPVAIKLVQAKLRPKIEPHILRHDITWEVREEDRASQGAAPRPRGACSVHRLSTCCTAPDVRRRA